MKTFNDLEFNLHPIAIETEWMPEDMKAKYKDTRQAVMTFDNGYGVSVVLGSIFNSNGIDTYEIAVLDGGKISNGDPVIINILGNINVGAVTEIMKKVQELQ